MSLYKAESGDPPFDSILARRIEISDYSGLLVWRNFNYFITTAPYNRSEGLLS